MQSTREPRDLVPCMVAITERLLIDAGIAPGMRVLDVGCGRGDVALLAARLVGERGNVVGIDRDERALALARERAVGLTNVDFVRSDIGALSPDLGEFDAVVGRRVLMYQPDVTAVVRGLAAALRPGGLVVFQEHDSSFTPASPVPLPLHARVHGWMWRTVASEGGNVRLGFELASVFAAAGLEVGHVRAELVLQTPEAHYAVGPILRAMLPRIIEHGGATEAEIDVDTIDARLLAERRAANTTYAGELVFGAWAHKPRA